MPLLQACKLFYCQLSGYCRALATLIQVMGITRLEVLWGGCGVAQVFVVRLQQGMDGEWIATLRSQ